LRGRVAEAQGWIASLIMGMFDWYKPCGEIECQLIDEDAKISEEARQAFRLPEEFEIYSYDCQHHRVLAKCRTRDGIWSATSILSATDV
jgi:hypothetical protein